MFRPGLTGFRIISVCVILAILLVSPGCSSKSKDSQSKKPQTSSQQKAKSPQQMKSILSDLEKIITSVDQKIKTSKESSFQKSTQIDQAQGQQGGQQSQQSGQQGQSGQGSSQDQQGQSKSQSGGQGGGQSSSQSQTSSWQTEDTALKNIHSNWNSVEPEAVKAGLGIPARDAFEKALEELTMAISKEKKEESLKAAIDLYGQYAELVRVFDGSIPPEFFQTKFEIMSAVQKAEKLDWSGAQKHIPNIQKYWGYLKMKSQGQDEKLMSRTEYSIEDLDQAITGKELDPVLIKAEIAMKNLQQLQKKLSSKSSSMQQ